MPTITINGRALPFQQGETILQVALKHEIEIPHYCYHPGLTIPANCRICLAEVHAPNPRNGNKLEPIPKLVPTCQTGAGDGQVVYTDSPKAIANQKAVMEYLLINHPVDCAVCDQAGECYLQDYSYQYGRSASRFEEAKNKQPKKDVGPHVLLYSDRCIMCTRCVRFTREVTGTGELTVEGRGSTAQIDVFPGRALENELSGNVVDICPVGALLDKDFLFRQRVWFLKRAASIDGLTCSGDNIFIEHNQGRVHRVKPRFHPEVNTWWITDEVRYGWKFIHSDDRILVPTIRGREPFELSRAREAYVAAYGAAKARLDRAMGTGKRLGVLVSPMLSCEDAYHVAQLGRSIDPEAVLGVGPVPREGEDKTFPGGFRMYAEKAPNARGVRRVLEGLSPRVLDAERFMHAMTNCAAVIVTGNYPSGWATPALMQALSGRTVILLDTLRSPLSDAADIVIPGATWAEKAGTFMNVHGRVQAFERAIDPIDFCKSEAQIALDLEALYADAAPPVFNPVTTRELLAGELGLLEFVEKVETPRPEAPAESDMQMVEL